MAKEFTLENVRLSWVFVDKPDENGKFRVTSLLDKKNPDHKAIRNEILDEVDRLLDDGIKNIPEWKGREPKNILELKNGDNSDYEYEQGHWLLGSSNKNEVPMVLQNKDKEATGRDIYAGVYANVVVQVYAMGGKYPGIYCSLEAIQKVKDGDRLSGGGPVNPKTKFKNIAGADEDDDRPARRRDDDEPRRRRDDDDDAPKRRSRDDDDEPRRRDRDEDEPKRRDRDEEKPKRRDSDEDEPRRRNRDEDEPRKRDRDEDAPRRRSDRDDDNYDRGRERGRDRF